MGQPAYQNSPTLNPMNNISYYLHFYMKNKRVSYLNLMLNFCITFADHNIMKKETSTARVQGIKNVVAAFMRAFLILMFGVGSLFGFIAGFYALLSYMESQQSLVTYHKENLPNRFPVLVSRAQKDGHPTAQLEFLDLSKEGPLQRKFYQIPGEGEVQVNSYDSGQYRIEKISDTRKLVTLNIWAGGGDRKERYVYEVKDNRIYPRSYQLMAYFGWFFSAIPLGLLATLGFLLVCKSIYHLMGAKMAVRKLNPTP